MILTVTLDSIKADEHFKEVNYGAKIDRLILNYFSFQHPTYFAQVTAKYNLLTSLQKTVCVAVKEELLDPEDTDLKSNTNKSELFLALTSQLSEQCIQLLMEIYRLHENIGASAEEGNLEKNCEKDPISAGFTLKTFSEVSTTKFYL